MKAGVLTGLCVLAMAGVVSGVGYEPTRSNLYTRPDPDSSGGITGTISKPAKPIFQILAMPPDHPELVYEGKVTGENKQGFLFENLPMAKYDLFVVYENEFYEGLELSYEPDTLTDKDRKSIEYIVNASDPFFHQKVVHRIEGTTGRGHLARCVVTQYREGPGTVYGDLTKFVGNRRTFKLIWLKDVGVGWQVVQKRDLYPVNTTAEFVTPKHHYAKVLSKIRVTDVVKDVGAISLGNNK